MPTRTLALVRSSVFAVIVVGVMGCGGDPNGNDVTEQDGSGSAIDVGLPDRPAPPADAVPDATVAIDALDEPALDVADDVPSDGPDASVLDAAGDALLDAPNDSPGDSLPEASADAPSDVPAEASPDAGACAAGQLMCPVGGVPQCVSVQSDEGNCGRCGVACTGATRCVAGACTTVTGLSAGRSHTCAVAANGRVACWGANARGELGTAPGEARSTPELVEMLTDASAVAAGDGATCVLRQVTRTSAEAMCWGANDVGQSGRNMGVSATVLPGRTVRTRANATMSGATQLPPFARHECAVYGTAVNCWGDNSNFQHNNRTPTVVPYLGTTSLQMVTSLAVSERTTCITRSGQNDVVCAGGDQSGELGRDGRGVATEMATVVFGFGTASPTSEVFGGGKNFCAINGTTRRVSCWGDNTYGQLTMTAGAAPVRVPVVFGSLTAAASVAVSDGFICVRLMNGQVWCAGRNDFGQLGDGTRTSRSEPQMVPGISDARAVAAGGNHVCVLHADGGVSCWGSDASGQLGTGRALAGDGVLTAPARVGWF